jgi:tRNA U34 5-carboxymethylaminomethyl modifying enzyme MnmG/GidA
MGARSMGKKVGAIGDIGFFSLGRGKNVSALSGGIIITDKDFRILRTNGIFRQMSGFTEDELNGLKLKEILSHLAVQYNDDVVQEVEFSTKYAGYIKRNQQLMARFTRYEDYSIPAALNYSSLDSLSSEAKEKLSKIRPASFGQASRISGISPADLAVLLVYLEKEKQTGHVPRET